ncbi:MAG: beta-galactosidase trimerization domain-containing protein [Bryobacteraceae bacterium]|nr:beta-galactosidase trimerization domain-containing protein [Bryobacteraceae bacterium]
MRALCLLIAAAGIAVAQSSSTDDPFLHQLYERLHDSPMQQKFRKIAPMPFGVVFLPWRGVTELQIREHFRLMKKLGFHNLKQLMHTPEWPLDRLMEIAFEEDIIPFWYGEGGWEDITPALLAKLGIPAASPIADIRRSPAMRAYQKEVLRRGTAIAIEGTTILEGKQKDPNAFRHTPDPMLREADVPHFLTWLREKYRAPAEIAIAWNQYEVGINEKPVQTWEDVAKLVRNTAQQENNLRGYGGEYGRVVDVLRYKADFHSREILDRVRATNAANPAAPTRTGGEMGLFLPFAWRATKMEDLAETQREYGSFYPSIHFAWHFGEVGYEVARTIYMQAQFARDLFKGGWAASWESTGGPQQLTGAKGWDQSDRTTTPGFTVNAGTISQLFLSYLAAGFRGAGIWTWNYRAAGWEGGEYALLDRNLKPSTRAVRAGQIAQAAERLRDELWQAKKEPYVGVLVNWDSDAIWAAISVRGRDHFRHYPMQARVGVSRALINANVPWEYVTVKDLRAGLGPRYKAIYLPAQIAITDELLDMLTQYARQGGRVVLDSPGAMYDERGKVLTTAVATRFESLFGAELSDIQYSGNVPRTLDKRRVDGFISEITPTSAKVTDRFQTGEPAVTENRIAKGSAVMLGWAASHSLFRPGSPELERKLVRAVLGNLPSPYSCDSAIVYRLAAPEADHYFLINDDEPKLVRLDTKAFSYKSVADPVTGEKLEMGTPIALEGYSARWLRFAK